MTHPYGTTLDEMADAMCRAVGGVYQLAAFARWFRAAHSAGVISDRDFYPLDLELGELMCEVGQAAFADSNGGPI